MYNDEYNNKGLSESFGFVRDLNDQVFLFPHFRDEETKRK